MRPEDEVKNALIAALVAAAVSAGSAGADVANPTWTPDQLSDLQQAFAGVQAKNDAQDAQIDLLGRRADRLKLRLRVLANRP